MQIGLPLEPIGRKLYTVSELNAQIRNTLDAEFSNVWVSGEISGARLAPSGHWYFTLKDGGSQIRCACFRMTVRYLRFKPQDGIEVLARGRIDVYEARGEYQLLIDALEPRGHGALQLAFDQLKKKLQLEGLFEQDRKRALPKLPRRIGIVTSPSGAVIQDILNIFERRFPGLGIRIYPVPVQGEGSVEGVCRGLRYFSESGWAEVVIVARGGGSLEDLWTFNEEVVARTIAGSSIPVISAIGHETDFTIADFVADLRAPTPSAAAELVICTREQLIDQVARQRQSIEQALRYKISMARQRLQSQGADRGIALLQRRIGRSIQQVDELDRCGSEAMRRRLRDLAMRLSDADERVRGMDLRLRFAEARRKLDRLQHDGKAAMRLRLARAAARLNPLRGELVQLSPLRVLERGYAIVHDASGRIVKEAGSVSVGDALRIRLASGELEAVVSKKDEAN